MITLWYTSTYILLGYHRLFMRICRDTSAGIGKEGVCMDSGTISVRMLGEFSITLNEKAITDTTNRSKKVWLLLAYMIYCRSRSIAPSDLTNLLWSEEESSSNPLNALKTVFHRVRSTLDQLGSSVGHSLILRKDGCYIWNQAVPLQLDTEEFDALCKAGAEAEGDARLAYYQKAQALYTGDFLPRLSSEPWVVPISAYYHNLYIRTVLESIPLLDERQRYEELVALCRSAIALEPYQEALYQHLMRGLLTLGRQAEAAQVYEDMSQLLLSNFGIMPSEESRTLYREAMRTGNHLVIPADTVQEQLREASGPAGALVCDYDFFKAIYHAEARSVARSGAAIHIALLSIEGEGTRALPRRSLDCAMDNLLEVVRSSLRRGDIVSRCSISQYILMLPNANYENSCKVCQRIVRSFFRQFPHSPARIHTSVQPLEPNL